MAVDLRLLQVARLLALPAGLTAAAARAAIAARPADFAAGLVAEAADNDDVISAAAARDYLEARLHDFGELVPWPAGDAVRAAFAALVTAWDA